MGYYAHKYSKGDLLIWDNIQTLHRSSGQYTGRRLLYKTQGRYKSKANWWEIEELVIVRYLKLLTIFNYCFEISYLFEGNKWVNEIII